MNYSEKALLLAVRDRLMLPTSAGGAGFTENECDIEYDEMAPATVGNTYVAVMPGGWVPGPRHRTSGGINDLVYGVSIVVIKRAANVPRDRKREVFLGNLDALTQEIDRVYAAIDFSDELRNAANALLAKFDGSTHGFIENLKFVSIDPKPRPVPAEIFAASRDPAAGLLRVISFHGARRITIKT